jgi:anti-sigma28 factor (negative regulator of flagellin synthesis)
MKARIQQGTNTSILLAHVYPDRMKQSEAHAYSIARVNAQYLALSDVTARIAWIKMLKTQIAAGTYIVNSYFIAQKIQSSHIMGAIPKYERSNISLATQEGEPLA